MTRRCQAGESSRSARLRGACCVLEAGSMRDERKMRRPGFLDGPSIRLGDGQLWAFPSPDGIASASDHGAATRTASDAAVDLEFEATLRAVIEAEDEAEQLRAELALAIYLLSRNYDLGPADYRAILGPPSSQTLEAMKQSFHQLAMDHIRSYRRGAPIEPGAAIEKNRPGLEGSA